MKRKLNIKRLIIAIVVLILIIILFSVSMFFFMLSPVGKNKDDVQYEVEIGTTPYEIFKDLKEKELIRNDFFLKIYSVLVGGVEIDAGTYIINDTMSSIEIFKQLSGKNYQSGEQTALTFKEGFNISQLIEIVTEKTNITEQMIKEKLEDKEYLNSLIEKYWFLTNDILNEEIYYSLEGYLFPNTYYIDEFTSVEDLFKVMLDETNRVLSKHKETIENSEYSIHELLTLASIVEQEAILDEDRPLVASVFYNRLDEGMPFQSCATLGYAIGEWKLTYTEIDLDSDSPYNTYKYSGFPPGPGNNPGEKSIESALNPAQSEYYYFMADVCSQNPKTYFSTNLRQHQKYADEYLTCF